MPTLCLSVSGIISQCTVSVLSLTITGIIMYANVDGYRHCLHQAEVETLRSDVAHLFLALNAAESRHQQELAGVVIDAAQHQTKVSCLLPCAAPVKHCCAVYLVWSVVHILLVGVW